MNTTTCLQGILLSICSCTVLLASCDESSSVSSTSLIIESGTLRLDADKTSFSEGDTVKFVLQFNSYYAGKSSYCLSVNFQGQSTNDTAIVIGTLQRDTVTDEIDESTGFDGFMRLCESDLMDSGMNRHYFSVYFPDARHKTSRIICEAHVVIDSIVLGDTMYDVYSERVDQELPGVVNNIYGPNDKIWLNYVPK